MATLTTEDLQKIRQECARTIIVNYTKAQINAAAQAVEDWIQANAASLSTAINAATTPLVLTAAQKKKLVAEYCDYKFNKDK